MPWTTCASHSSPGRLLSPPRAIRRASRVLDHRTVAIPERPGNLHAETFRTVLQQPRVGLIFLVPGKGGNALGKRDGPHGAGRGVGNRLAVAGRAPGGLCPATLAASRWQNDR